MPKDQATCPALSVSDAILSRHSCRAFTAQPVDQAIIQGLLKTARYAPSGGNLQPWLVHVLSGESMIRFQTMLSPKRIATPMGAATEYPVYPDNLKEPYRARRSQAGEDMYGQLGIDRAHRPARLQQFAQNFDFFGAPVGMFFFVDRSMGAPQWSDIGMFMQNLMLLAREVGLDTCAQESWAVWHREVAEFFCIEPNLMLFSGLSLGYAEASAPINRLRTARAAVNEFAVFHH